MPTTGNYFHLHLVSDSTGETLITVARAVAAQYANVTPVEHVYPLVRSQKQLDRVLDEIEEAPGIVLFTLLEKDLVARLDRDPRVAGHYRLDAVRGHLLERAGDRDKAARCYRAAAGKTTSTPERNYLLTKAARVDASASPRIP